jgi:16S rRNA (guanine527-N7)-methyltransferase
MFHVKHSLEKTLKKLKIPYDSYKLEKLLLYLEELILWNKKINLISRKMQEKDILNKLILPSLTPYHIIKKGEKILDFGAGGGIASIPLKILKPEITLHLLEAKKKPVIFLEHINLLLSLEAETTNKFVLKRGDLEEEYDWVFVRAVNPEQIPKGIANKMLYYGKYTGDKFTCQEKILFKKNIISVLV